MLKLHFGCSVMAWWVFLVIQAQPAEDTAVLCINGRFYGCPVQCWTPCSCSLAVPLLWSVCVGGGGAGAFIGFSKLQLFPGYFRSICAMLCGTETGCESVVNHLHTRKKYRYGRQCLHGSAVCLLQKCFLFSNIMGIQDIRWQRSAVITQIYS